jgi:hypothetical protein
MKQIRGREAACVTMRIERLDPAMALPPQICGWHAPIRRSGR